MTGTDLGAIYGRGKTGDYSAPGSDFQSFPSRCSGQIFRKVITELSDIDLLHFGAPRYVHFICTINLALQTKPVNEIEGAKKVRRSSGREFRVERSGPKNLDKLISGESAAF